MELRERGAFWSGSVRLGDERQPAALARGRRTTFKAVNARINSLGAVAGIVALTGIAAGALSSARQSAPVTTATAAQFDQRWDMPDDPAPLKKQDRLALQTPEPVPVVIEREVPPPVKMPAAVRTAEADEDRPVRHRESNVCTRHHMRKVETHGGRSWRCRK